MPSLATPRNPDAGRVQASGAGKERREGEGRPARRKFRQCQRNIKVIQVNSPL
jgi:hypothetical protein